MTLQVSVSVHLRSSAVAIYKMAWLISVTLHKGHICITIDCLSYPVIEIPSIRLVQDATKIGVSFVLRRFEKSDRAIYPVIVTEAINSIVLVAFHSLSNAITFNVLERFSQSRDPVPNYLD